MATDDRLIVFGFIQLKSFEWASALTLAHAIIYDKLMARRPLDKQPNGERSGENT